MSADFDTEHVPVEDLTPHPENYKEHPQEQIDQIKQSIREHGIYRNIVIARDGTILAGHGVVRAAEQLGYEALPAERLNYAPDSAVAKKVMAADNELPKRAPQDDLALAGLLDEINESEDVDLGGTGYDENSLQAFAEVAGYDMKPDAPEGEEGEQEGGEDDHWDEDMPDFEPEPDPIQTTVDFDSEGDREDFFLALGLTHEQIEAREEEGTLSYLSYPPHETYG